MKQGPRFRKYSGKLATVTGTEDHADSAADGVNASSGPELSGLYRRAAGRRPPRKPNDAVESRAPASRLALPVSLFIVALAIPLIITIGAVRMTPYRFVLVVALLPSILSWIRGRAGRVLLADLAFVFFCLWCAISLYQVHGIETAIKSGGILTVEALGAYLLGRLYIRNADDFERMSRLLFLVILVLLPFSMIEFFTGIKPLLTWIGAFWPTVEITMMDARMGLRRVQGPFDHPILFGACCCSAFTLTLCVLGFQKPFFQRWLRAGIVGFSTLMSLSSGPIVGVILSCLLLAWDRVLNTVAYRWYIFWGLLLSVYMTIATFSSQSVPAFYVTYAPSFDKWTAYYRLLIWEYGTASVQNHPLFGIGFGDWVRPAWMPSSIDSFWLATFVSYGIPGGAAMCVGCLAMVFAVARTNAGSERVAVYRRAYLITMGSLFFVGFTVHFWNASFVLFMFLVGSGSWIIESAKAQPQTAPARKPPAGFRPPARSNGGPAR